MESISRRWWEIATLLLAANSVLFGYLGIRAGEWAYAIGSGFLPAALLVAAVLLAERGGLVRAAPAVAGALMAATSFWMVYPVVLAGIVILGTFWTGRVHASGGAHHP